MQSNAIDKIYVYIPRSIKRMRLVILARKGKSVVARVRWQKKTRYMCIFLVLNVAKHQKCFYKTHAARNSCSKGNIGRSKSALAEKDKIYVYIPRSKRGKTPEMFL